MLQKYHSCDESFLHTVIRALITHTHTFTVRQKQHYEDDSGQCFKMAATHVQYVPSRDVLLYQFHI